VTFLQALLGDGSETRHKLSLLAIDEAHCISEWGHDFRPDYLHIAEARRKLGNPLTVALTATATPKVQSDIVRLLALPDSTHNIVTGFNRPNLTLEVKYTADTEAKFRALNDLLTLGSGLRPEPNNGATLIYTGTRRDAEEVAEFVRVICNLKAEHYHAGLPAEDRTRIQERFINGATPIIVATNAFGMGIDRADVRQVIHYSLPGSLEAYYQEAGRAGRDGLPARVVLLYDPQDRALQEFFISSSVVSPDELKALYRALGNVDDEIWMTADEFSRRTDLHQVKVNVGLAELERVGALEHLGDDGVRMLLRKGKWDSVAVEKAALRSKEHTKHRTDQLNRMVNYAETNACRRKIILKHFGDNGSADAPVCCDNCETRKSMPESGGNVASMSHAEKAALTILDAAYRLKFKVGREKLARILAGSKAQEIKKFNYDKSIYYAKLAEFRKSEIEGMIDQLLEMEYFKIVGGLYTVLTLTPKGEAALKQKALIPLNTPKVIGVAEALRARVAFDVGGTVEQTAKLFANGMKPEQIAKERGLALQTIFDHIAQLIAVDRISVEQVVSNNIREQVEKAIDKVGSTRFLSPIKSILPEEIDFNMIRCIVAGYRPHEIPENSVDLAENKSPSSNHIQHIVALGESKSSSAVPELIAALKSEDGNARRLAASALGKIGDSQAVQPLIDLLVTEIKPQVRQYAVKALGSIGDPRAIDLLTKISENENEMYYTRDSAKAALKRLNRIGTISSRTYVRFSSKTMETSEHIEELIIECIRSLSGKLPRSGVAKLLVGSLSERVEAYQSHPLYNRLEGKSRSEVMVYVDKLLENGQLRKAENGCLILGNSQATTNLSGVTRNPQLVTPPTQQATRSTPHAPRPTQHDPIASYLSSSHPRPLTGNWHTGFALDFHSSFKGADWNRSGVGDLTYRLKYQSDSSALPALVEHTRKLFLAHPEMNQFDIILPVPSSTPREFNPVHEFCKALSRAFGKPLQTFIAKTRQTKPQKEMQTLPQKRDNVAGAFVINNDITGKRILLVDDLFDSGATLEEITKLLLKHKASRVNVLTLTRTIHADA